MRFNLFLPISLFSCGFILSNPSVAAPEEIQVYMDEMDAPGHFGLDVHNNYVVSGSTVPDYPGAVPPAYLYRFTPEFSYGLTPSFELGAYILTSTGPYSEPSVDGEKVRIKYIAPKADGQNYFWGANLEVGKVDLAMERNPWNAELKGIYGYRTEGWTFAINTNLDWSIQGPAPEPLSLELDSKVAYAVSPKYQLGFESYNAIGPVQQLGPLYDQSQTLYAVIDTAIKGWDLNFGIGRGLSSVSDHVIVKAIVGVPID